MLRIPKQLTSAAHCIELAEKVTFLDIPIAAAMIPNTTFPNTCLLHIICLAPWCMHVLPCNQDCGLGACCFCSHLVLNDYEANNSASLAKEYESRERNM
jgi:hypothetical protein